MFKLSKKIALPLIAVLLIGTGIGGYFLFRNFQLPKYFVDRYPELLDYCDTQQNGNNLRVSCKALMLDIKPNNGSPSLTSLIISNDEELKEYTVTEEEEVFSFTNDILQFKKLKPVIINIQYTKINPIKYAVQGITFEDIPETYIQEIVNRDIEEIMGMDKSSTTILNSFDFCPRPETLPDYVIKKEEYAKYWEKNILPQSEYLKAENYNLENSEMELLFACDSAKNLQYEDLCFSNNIKQISTFSSPKDLNFDETSNNTDDRLLSLMLQLYNTNNIKNYPVKIDATSILNILTPNLSSNPSPTIFCAVTKIFSLEETQKNTMTDMIESNLSLAHLMFCEDILDDAINDTTGIFIKESLLSVSENFSLFNKCKNLSNFFYNE